MAAKHGLKPGIKGEFPFKPARLVDAKIPYVVCYAWDVNEKKLTRIRYSLKGDTDEARLADGQHLVKELNKRLKDGWHIDDDRPEPVKPSVVTPDVLTKKISVYQAYQFYKQVMGRDLRSTTMDLYNDYALVLFKFLLRKEGRDPDADPMPIPNTQLLRFTPPMASELFDTLTQGGRYRNNLLGWAKSFYKFFDMEHRGLVQKNPFAHLTTVPVDESDDHRPYTADQANQIRETILAKDDRQLWLFIEFAYFLFVRPGNELRLMRVGDILDKRVRIVSHHGKNRKTGFVDIPVQLEQTIQAHQLRKYPANHYLFTIEGHPGPEPCGKNYFYKRHAQVLKTLGLYGLDYDLYSWKPTGAIALYRHTKDVLRVQRHCRHSSPDQTYTYLRKHGEVFAGQDLTDFPAVWTDDK
ncbi:hypothetical protein [Fibrella forsythiae]|uniref:Site-specific integrase n=1 Tax=Fibrella forsythiae TaxID=2817061 RepID=A0ABS3JL15_9BACT|nr:hypothetical protein [Fibrella forsythiae]MBO0950704.1 hypothetical protein [Fibrella forsythiae]